jgi:hypothetical protein
MWDRRAVNLQKVHSSRLLVVSAAIFVFRGSGSEKAGETTSRNYE